MSTGKKIEVKAGEVFGRLTIVKIIVSGQITTNKTIIKESLALTHLVKQVLATTTAAKNGQLISELEARPTT